MIKIKKIICCHVSYIVVDVPIFSFLIAVLFNANESLYVLETEYIYFHHNMALFRFDNYDNYKNLLNA